MYINGIYTQTEQHKNEKNISWTRQEIKAEICKSGKKYGASQASNYGLKAIVIHNEINTFKYLQVNYKQTFNQHQLP